MIRTRSRVAIGVIATLAALLAIVALGLGEYPLSPLDVIHAIAVPSGFDSTIVLEWRLPRVVAALVFGAALGASGALFQSLTRNPLGSPDVIGFSTGSYTGAIIAITLLGGSGLAASTAALAAGLITALVVYALAYRRGVQGFRLIVVGIAVTAVLHSLNTLLLLRAQTEVAMTAAFWGAGSLALVSWADLAPAGALLTALGLATAAVARPLRQLELGDDAARAHGVRVSGARLAIVIVGVGLVAIVTATTGPIAFVALAAPQIAARLTRSPGVPLAASALTGALVLLAADQIAQHALPDPVPVGVVTVVLGGAYLIALLARETRRTA